MYNINYINIYINSTKKLETNKNKHKRINYFTKKQKLLK